MEMTNPRAPRARNNGQIVLGTLVVGLGLMLMAGRYIDRDLPALHSWWPLLLILMGAARLATGGDSCRDGRSRSRRGGVWLIMVGCWGLISEGRLFGFTYATSWPLLVVGAGIIIVWRSLETGDRPPMRREP